MINTIIFDIGNVLVRYDWRGYLRRLGFSDEMCKKIGEAVFENPLWKEFDRGVLGDKNVEQKCRALMAEYPDEMDKVFSNLEDLVMECGYAAGWIQSLKAKGYKVYVLSNYGRTLFGYARQNFRFLHYIDGGVISYEVQYIKPEIQIYERLIQKYGIRPQEAVFLDDTEENLPPARKLGMRTIHVTSHQAAVEGLKKLGIES